MDIDPFLADCFFVTCGKSWIVGCLEPSRLLSSESIETSDEFHASLAFGSRMQPVVATRCRLETLARELRRRRTSSRSSGSSFSHHVN